MPTPVTQIIRTVVPMLVGFILSLPVAKALGITNDQATALLTAILGALYYAAVALLEKKWPALGILLGKVGAPVYPPTAP